MAAWKSLDLQRREREVMEAVHTHFSASKFTRKELAERMGWAINRITGRVLTLIAKEYLRELPERRDGGYLLEINAPVQMELIAA